ncbi:MAG: flagellar hook-length control protein FliK [Betaproteobacteria bacterium]|nr:flagellar hook-length control protein FliK [Betaproteobacteria bacterium]
MVLIPADIGLRMRLQNELLPQPITPLQEIPADLPGLKAGQVFSARIQEVLPENTYRALVAGKTITLSLPESAKSGDTLELVVVDRSPQTIIARLASPSGGAAQAGSAATPQTTFSPAAQLLSTLLVAEGDTPQAAPLNRGQPLLARAPQSGADLVPVLSKAVAESGLFYEAHQAQWVAGKLPLASLLQEPQGQLSSPQAQLVAQAQLAMQANKLPPASLGRDPLAQPSTNAQGAAGGGTEAAARPNSLIKEAATQLQAGVNQNLSLTTSQESADSQRMQANSQTHPSPVTQSVPDELRPLVQQQLDAAGTQRLLWHGEVWPGQSMQWRVEWDGQGGENPDQGALEPWTTTLRLSTPRLGEVAAALSLGTSGVRIALVTPYASSMSAMRDGAAELEQALAGAGVPLLGLTVRHDRGADDGNANQ